VRSIFERDGGKHEYARENNGEKKEKKKKKK